MLKLPLKKIISLFCLIAVYILCSCSTNITTANSSDISSETTTQNIMDLTIDNYVGSALVIVNLNTSNSGSNETIGSTAPIIMPTSLAKKTTQDPQNNYIIRSRNTLTIKQPSFQQLTLSSIQALSTDSPPNFNIIVNGSFSSQEIQYATKLHDGTHCDIFVHDNANITQEHVTHIGNYYDTFLYTNAITLLGYPYDVDSNGKITIYFGDIGSGYLGYFYSADFYNSVDYYTSNESDIIYLNSSLLEELSDDVPNYTEIYFTLAHELIHLISYSARFNTYINTGNSAPIVNLYETWIEEGLAQGASSFLTNTNINQTSYTPIDITDHFNPGLNNQDIRNGLSLFNWGENYSPYILALTFMEYCRIHSDIGSDFYQNLLENYTTANDYRAVEDIVLENTSLFNNFEDIISSYRIANIINANTGKYGYNNIYSVGTINNPSNSSPTIGPGGAVYYQSSSTSEYNDFAPENFGDNIYYYRINNLGD